MVRHAVAATFAVLVMSANAYGAASWSEPFMVGSPAFSVGPPSAAFGASGDGLLAWSTLQTDVIQPGTEPTGHVAGWPFRAPPVEHVTPDTVVAAPQPVGDDRFVLLREHVLPPGPGPYYTRRVRLGVSTATTGGRLGRLRLVARFVTVSAQAIAVSPRGEVAVAWVERRGPGGTRDRLRLRVGRVARRLRPPRALGDLGPVEHPGITDVALAWGHGGELVLAYARTHSARGRTVRAIEVLTGRPGGRLRRETLGPHAGVPEIEVAASARGRVAVAWGSQDGGEEANKPFVVRAAIREVGRRRFSAPQILDPGDGRDQRPVGRLAVVMAPDGTTVAAWSAIRGERFPHSNPVLVATAPAGSRFAAPEQLDPDGAIGGLAIRADAKAVATWTPYPSGRQVLAALRDPGATAFASPEQVSTADSAGAPFVAFNPRTGEPAITWVDRPGAQPGIWPPPPAVLKAAVRAP